MRYARRRLAPAALALMTMVAAGCGLAGAKRPMAIENATDVPLMLHVNGAWVGTYAPGVTATADIGGHGGPPYQVAVMSPSGATLVTWTIDDAELAKADAPGEGNSYETTVPCGWIRLWMGEDSTPVRPSLDPQPCP